MRTCLLQIACFLNIYQFTFLKIAVLFLLQGKFCEINTTKTSYGDHPNSLPEHTSCGLGAHGFSEAVRKIVCVCESCLGIMFIAYIGSSKGHVT